MTSCQIYQQMLFALYTHDHVLLCILKQSHECLLDEHILNFVGKLDVNFHFLLRLPCFFFEGATLHEAHGLKIGGPNGTNVIFNFVSTIFSIRIS